MSLKYAVIFVIFASAVSAVPTRILGGENAKIGQFPYQASVQRDDSSHVCGGTIINERFILTAAHCVTAGSGIETYPPKFFQVRVGSIQRSLGGKLLKVKRIIVHKSLNFYWYDLALLKLDQTLAWTDNIKSIELATEEVPSGEAVIISGWGNTQKNGEHSGRLQWSSGIARRTVECDFDDSILCLTHDVDNGICSGDAGGPATYNDKLVGIASFVVGGCGTQYPNGYTKVLYHSDWILENSK